VKIGKIQLDSRVIIAGIVSAAGYIVQYAPDITPIIPAQYHSTVSSVLWIAGLITAIAAEKPKSIPPNSSAS
jgi:hypothetical protein